MSHLKPVSPFHFLVSAALLTVVFAFQSSVHAQETCESFDDCCDSDCSIPCEARPGAAPECRFGRDYTRSLDDGDFCIGSSCINGWGGCRPDVQDGDVTPCKKQVRSCILNGVAICDTLASGNNQCIVENPRHPNRSSPDWISAENDLDFCPKYACLNGRFDDTNSDGQIDDFDSDGLFDCWEVEGGIDSNVDGTIDFPLPMGPGGVDPFRKDILVEIDYFACTNAAGAATGDCAAGDTHSHAPSGAFTQPPFVGLSPLRVVIDAFAFAPVTNPVNPATGVAATGINLIIDADQERLPHLNSCEFFPRPGAVGPNCFEHIKRANFGSSTERMNTSTIAAKRVAVHYSLWIHDQAPGEGHSGGGGMLNANFVVSLGTNWDRTPAMQAGTFMHELGHNLGLDHGGMAEPGIAGQPDASGVVRSDAVNHKPNYFSVMNYAFGAGIPLNAPCVGCAPSFDFSRAPVTTLDETMLDEGVSVLPPPAAFMTQHYCPDGTLHALEPADGILAPGAILSVIDWNCNGSPAPDAGLMSVDINGDHICVEGGPDRAIDPFPFPFLNLYPWGDDRLIGGTIEAGPNGILDTTVIVPPDTPDPNTADTIFPGMNGILDTTALVGSTDFTDVDTVSGGTDGDLQTPGAIGSDDVVTCRPDPLRMPPKVCPPTTLLTPGRIVAAPGLPLATPVMFDDVVRNQAVWDGPDRICQTPNIADDYGTYAATGNFSTNHVALNEPQPALLTALGDWNGINLELTTNLRGFAALGPTAALPPYEPTSEMMRHLEASRVSADLSVATQSVRNSDGSITYQFTAANDGPEVPVNGKATIRIPQSLAISSCSSETGFCYVSGQTVAVSLGDLPAGQSMMIEVTVTPIGTPGPGDMIDVSMDADSTDPLPSNNATVHTCLLPPIFETVLSNLTAESCQTLALGTPVVSSSCGSGVTLVNDAPAQFPIGPSIVTWTAVDAHGNAAASQQIVTVQLGNDVSCCDADGDGLCSSEVILFSPESDVTLGGVLVAEEDIVRFAEASNQYTIYFDGSDVGLADHDIDAFTIRHDGSILMSFRTNSMILTNVGTVKKQDIILFEPTSLGANTAGTFKPFFVGSEHGLSSSSADIRGVYEAADGALYLTLGSNLTIGSLSVADEDVIRFDPATNDYSMIVDGSDVGLGSQAIDAFNFQVDGSLMLSLADYPEQSGLPGLPAGPIHNVFRFVPSLYPDSYGTNTSGAFHPFLVAALNQAPTSLNIDGVWRERSSLPTLYAAEFAALGGNAVLETTNGGFVGSAYVNSAINGSSIEFGNVHGGLGGPKKLRFRSALASGARTGRLVINGVAQSITFTPTGSWTSWAVTEVDAQLLSGPVNTIRLESTGQDLANIDQLEVATPPPSSQQGESAAIGGGAVFESINIGFIGTGYVNSSGSGGFIEFRNVEAGSGGNRTLRFRVALGGSNPRTGRLVVNGVAQNITFTPTGSWTNWTDHQVVVPLQNGGTNTIRLESTGNDLANIDQLTVL
jgi:hypothetical protein